MSIKKIKVATYRVSLNSTEDAVLRELMTSDYKERGEESTFFASLLSQVKKCRDEHSASSGKAGRPIKKREYDGNIDITNLPEAPILPVDTLSFTDDEKRKLGLMK